MFNYFKIADNTFKESVREPIFLVMLLTVMALIGHLPSMALFVFSEQMKMVVDGAMAATFTFGLLVVILASSYTVAREMRNGTVLLLLSKPVSRISFVLAKLTGIIFAGGVFVYICALSSLAAIYIATDQFRFDLGLYFGFFGVIAAGCLFGMLMNFFRGASFSAAALLGLTVLMTVFSLFIWKAHAHPEISLVNVIYAFLLLGMAVAVMAVLSMALALKFDMVANLCFCAALMFIGLISSYLFQRDTGSEIVNALFAGCYAVVPNWQYYWTADAIAVGRKIPFAYVLEGALYSLLYAALVSMWAAAIFRNRELAGEMH